MTVCDVSWVSLTAASHSCWYAAACSLFVYPCWRNWGRMEMIYCCKLLVQSSSTLQSLLVSSFRQTHPVAAFSSCKVSVYLVRKHHPPQHTVHRLSNNQQWHYHTIKSVLMLLASCRDIHVLCVAVYCFSKWNVYWVQFSKLVFANYG